MHTSRLGRPYRGLRNVQCEHGGQRGEREYGGEPGKPVSELRQNRCPGEAKGQKQEPRPWLVES